MSNKVTNNERTNLVNSKDNSLIKINNENNKSKEFSNPNDIKEEISYIERNSFVNSRQQSNDQQDYMNMNNNSQIKSNYIDKDSPNDYYDNDNIEKNIYDANQHKVSSTNFDDIPIQPRANNFLELLEKNLADDNNYDYQLNNQNIIKKNSYRPRPKRSDLLDIKPPAEVKKYKYYSQNFNKNFGKESDDVLNNLPINPPKESSRRKKDR